MIYLTELHTPNKDFSHLVFTLFLLFFLSFAYFSAVANGSLVSSLIRSVHLFLGLPLFLLLLKSSFIIHFCKLSSFKQHTCPNQIRRLSDCNGTRTHNHLVRKQTLSHLAKRTLNHSVRLYVFFELCFQYCSIVLHFFAFHRWRHGVVV